MPKIPEQLSRESLERERRRRKMREEVEHNWFVRWEEELPRPEDLMPLSQSLITHDLALAFDISAPNPNTVSANDHLTPLPSPPAADLDSVDFSASAGAASGGDESARTLKRPRLVWTPQLHKRFVDAVAHLGIRNAVPKTIMQLMSVEGLTRENVASHLQKYRLYLKRMQGLSSSAASAPGSGGLSGPISAADAATEQLFASNPIPHHFLGRGIAGHGQEPFMQLMASPLVQHHQQMMAASTAAQQLYFHQRKMEHFGSPAAANGGYIHGFLASDAAHSPGLHGMETVALDMMQPPMEAPPPNSNVGDLDSSSGGRGRRALTLFPTGSEN